MKLGDKVKLKYRFIIHRVYADENKFIISFPDDDNSYITIPLCIRFIGKGFPPFFSYIRPDVRNEVYHDYEFYFDHGLFKCKDMWGSTFIVVIPTNFDDVGTFTLMSTPPSTNTDILIKAKKENIEMRNLYFSNLMHGTFEGSCISGIVVGIRASNKDRTLRISRVSDAFSALQHKSKNVSILITVQDEQTFMEYDIPIKYLLTYETGNKNSA